MFLIHPTYQVNQLRSFSFDGGSRLNFVQAVSSITTQPVIFTECSDFYHSASVTSRFRLQFNSVSAVVRLLHSKLGDADSTNTYLGFNGNLLEPMTLWSYFRLPRFAPKASVSSTVSVNNGFVTVSRPEPIYVSTLSALKWSKVLKFDPIYRYQIVDVSARHAREEVFIRTLAAALGANVLESRSTIRIVPKASEFQEMASDTALWCANHGFDKSSNWEKADLLATSLAFKDADRASIVNYLTKRGIVKIPHSEVDSKLGLEIKTLCILSVSGVKLPTSTAGGRSPDWNTGTVTLRYFQLPMFELQSKDKTLAYGF